MGAFDIATYADHVRRPALRALYIQFFLYSFAFAAFMSGFALFAERRFIHDGAPWSTREVGYLFALTLAGFLAIGISNLLLAWVPDDGWILLCVITIGSSFGNSIMRPVLTSRITKTVGPQEQGTAIGIAGSLSAVATMLAPPTGGFLLNHGLLGREWPMVSVTMALSGLLVGLAATRNTPTTSP